MKRILTPKVILAAFIIAAVLLCSSLIYILVERPVARRMDQAAATSILTIIPAPTSTPRPMPPTLTPSPPTPMSSPTAAPGEIAIGVYVQPNTDQTGLNIRSEPGLASEVLFSGFDSEVFLVTKGPEQVDGYTWWYLTASYDTIRAGWAAQEYLTAIPSP
ncbi:MAG: SH3 domain-containing protein [Chloroflexota bacterium]